MINPRDISLIVKAVGIVVKDYVAAALLTLSDEIDRRIKAIPAGPKGDRGEKGDSGDKGDRGDSIVGPPGEKGEPGLSIRGDKGADGKDIDAALVVAEVLRQIPTPKDGLAGKDGISISMDAVRELVLSEVQKAVTTIVAAIPAPKDGERGLPGKDAAPIHPDTLRLLVIDEVQKTVAAIPQPRDGKDGEDGENGRDANQIEVLPMIDPTKSYPRGTQAEYKGGTIRANRTTDPITSTLQAAGWSVMHDGEADYEAALSDDKRTVRIKRTLTSGRVFDTTLTFPVMIYREIYREGVEYVEGDVVTWGDSAWCCVVKSTKALPRIATPGEQRSERPPDWRMMVRKGGEGKPGGKGDKGDPGKDGRDGKDLTQMAPNGRKW